MKKYPRVLLRVAGREISDDYITLIYDGVVYTTSKGKDFWLEQFEAEGYKENVFQITADVETDRDDILQKRTYVTFYTQPQYRFRRRSNAIGSDQFIPSKR